MENSEQLENLPETVPSASLMSTIDLVKVINATLTSGETVRHNNLMRKARTYLESCPLLKLSSIVGKNSEIIEYFELTKVQAVALAGTYSYEVSKAVYDRMTALEDAVAEAGRQIATLTSEKKVLSEALVGVVSEFSHVATLLRFAQAEYQADQYMRTHKKANSAVVLKHAIDNQKAMQPTKDYVYSRAMQIVANDQLAALESPLLNGFALQKPLLEIPS